MRINAAYKEGLKKILETGDMSRVRQEALEEARKAIQAQVETEALEYQEPMKDDE